VRKNGRNIFVGCSGWSYPHWKGEFYPADLPQKRWFEFYSGTFDTVEINNTFYRLPEEKTFEGWAAKAREGFVYSVKASRYITHIRRLKDVEDSVSLILKRTRLLKEHLGPILYQFPPNFSCHLDRFESLLKLLPRDLIHVVEFRDQRWINDQTFALLEAYNVGHCVHDKGGLQIPWRAIGPVTYVRFHGSEQSQGSYSDRELERWADWLESETRKKERDIYAYFNNDFAAHAVFNAQTLRKKLVGK